MNGVLTNVGVNVARTLVEGPRLPETFWPGRAYRFLFLRHFFSDIFFFLRPDSQEAFYLPQQPSRQAVVTGVSPPVLAFIFIAHTVQHFHFSTFILIDFRRTSQAEGLTERPNARPTYRPGRPRGPWTWTRRVERGKNRSRLRLRRALR